MAAWAEACRRQRKGGCNPFVGEPSIPLGAPGCRPVLGRERLASLGRVRDATAAAVWGKSLIGLVRLVKSSRRRLLFVTGGGAEPHADVMGIVDIPCFGLAETRLRA